MPYFEMDSSITPQIRFIILTIALMLSAFSVPSRSFTLPQNSLEEPVQKEVIETQQEIAVNVQDLSQMEVLVDIPELKQSKDAVIDLEEDSKLTAVPEVAHEEAKNSTAGNEVNEMDKESPPPDESVKPSNTDRIPGNKEQTKSGVQVEATDAISAKLLEQNNGTVSDELIQKSLTLRKEVGSSEEKSVVSETVEDLKESPRQSLEKVDITEVNITVANGSALLSLELGQKEELSEELKSDNKLHSSVKGIIEVSESQKEQITLDINNENLQRPALTFANATFNEVSNSSKTTTKAESTKSVSKPQVNKTEDMVDEKTSNIVKNAIGQEENRETNEKSYSSITERPNEQTTREEDVEDVKDTEIKREQIEPTDLPLSLEQRIAAWLLGKKSEDQDQKSSWRSKNDKEVTDSSASSTGEMYTAGKDDQQQNGGNNLKSVSNTDQDIENFQNKEEERLGSKISESQVSASAAMEGPKHVAPLTSEGIHNNKNTEFRTNQNRGETIPGSHVREETTTTISNVKERMKSDADKEVKNEGGEVNDEKNILTTSETKSRRSQPDLSTPVWLSDVPLTNMRENSRGHIQDKSLRETNSEEFLTTTGTLDGRVDDWIGHDMSVHGEKNGDPFKSQFNFETNKRDYEDSVDLSGLMSENVIYNDDIVHDSGNEINYYKTEHAYYYNYDPEKINLPARIKPSYLEYNNRDFNDRANLYYKGNQKSGQEIPWDQRGKITGNVYHHEHAPTAFQTLENFVEDKPDFGKKKFSKTHTHRYDVHGADKHVEISPFMARISISKKGADEALATIDNDNDKEESKGFIKNNLSSDSDTVQADVAETNTKLPITFKEATENADGGSNSNKQNITPKTGIKTVDEGNKHGASVTPSQEQIQQKTNKNIDSKNVINLQTEVNTGENKTVTITLQSKQKQANEPDGDENGTSPRKDATGVREDRSSNKNGPTTATLSSSEVTKSAAEKGISSSTNEATPDIKKQSSASLKISTVADSTGVSQDENSSTQKIGETKLRSSKNASKNDSHSTLSNTNQIGSGLEPDTAININISNETVLNIKVSSSDDKNEMERLSKQESTESNPKDVKPHSASDSVDQNQAGDRTVATLDDNKNSTADSKPSNTGKDVKINDANNTTVDGKSLSPLPKLESLLEAYKLPNSPASIDKRDTKTKAVLKSDDKTVVLTLNEKGPAKKEEQQPTKAGQVTISASVSVASEADSRDTTKDLKTTTGNFPTPATTTVTITEKFHEVNNSDSVVPFLQKDASVTDDYTEKNDEVESKLSDSDNDTSIVPAISNSKSISVKEAASNKSSDSDTNNTLSVNGKKEAHSQPDNLKEQNPTSKAKLDSVSGSLGVQTSNSKAEPQISNFAPQNSFSRKLLSVPDAETEVSNNNTKPQTTNPKSTSNTKLSSENGKVSNSSHPHTADNGHELYDEVLNVTIQAATTAKTPESTPHSVIINVKKSKTSSKEDTNSKSTQGDSQKKTKISNDSNSKTGATENRQKDTILKDDSVSIDHFLSSQNKSSIKESSDADKNIGPNSDKNGLKKQDTIKTTKGNETTMEVMANESSFHTQSRNFSTKVVSPPSVVSNNITAHSSNRSMSLKAESAKKLNSTSLLNQKSNVEQDRIPLTKDNATKENNGTNKINSQDQAKIIPSNKKTPSVTTGNSTTNLKDLNKTKTGTPKKNEDVKNTTSGDGKSSNEKVLKTVGGLPYYSSAAAAVEREVPPISAYRLQDFSLAKPVKNDKKKEEKGSKASDKKGKKEIKDDPKTKSSNGNESKSDLDDSSDGCKSSCNQEPDLPVPRPQAAVSAVLTTHFGPTKDQMVPFDLELLDLADNYDNTTGMFICTIPGTYVISLYLMSHPGAKVNARVFINNRPIAALWADDAKNAGFYPSSSTQTIAQLGFGDQVYVMLVDGGYGESWVHANYNVFTVFLLYEQLF